MRKITKFALGTAVAVAAAGTTLTTAPPAHAGNVAAHGCPSGAVCIYPNASWNGDHPEPGGIYWSHGPHNLVNQFGDHRIYNNQYGGWRLSLNWGYNGTDPFLEIQQDEVWDVDLTEVNSITIYP